MMNHGQAALATLVALSVPAAGCFVSTREPPPAREVVVDGTEPREANSTLVVKWTIAGLTDPNECIKAQAKKIEISIADRSGTELGAYEQDCTAFSTSITLRPGTYSAYAALVDDAGKARTTDVTIRPFTLRANDSLTTPIDFPSNSFR
jgi:hypothetical protein